MKIRLQKKRDIYIYIYIYIYIEETVFSDWKQTPFTWSDIKKVNPKDDDYIISRYDPGDEDNDWQGSFRLEVTRNRLETDEEFNKRQAGIARQSAWNKERRYQSYLKMKAEFENNSDESSGTSK